MDGEEGKGKGKGREGGHGRWGRKGKGMRVGGAHSSIYIYFSIVFWDLVFLLSIQQTRRRQLAGRTETQARQMRAGSQVEGGERERERQ